MVPVDSLSERGSGFSDDYPAVAASIPRARTAVARFAHEAGASEESVEAVRLASSEALTNAVLHAYGDEPGGVIHVTAAVASDELWLLIADDGCGLRGSTRGESLGIGLALI